MLIYYQIHFLINNINKIYYKLLRFLNIKVFFINPKKVIAKINTQNNNNEANVDYFAIYMSKHELPD